MIRHALPNLRRRLLALLRFDMTDPGKLVVVATLLAVATGTLTLTATNYTISITHPAPADPAGAFLTTEDTGTYQTDGNTWTQESDNAGGFQGVGTFSLVAGILTVDVTTAGVQVLTVWSSTD